jgi:uncharacterized protein
MSGSAMALLAVFMRIRHGHVMTRIAKVFYLCLGWFFVGLAIVGIIFPIFPTVPFLICAVWAFSKASPVLAEKLRNHPRFGPLIRDWQDHGAIPVYGKVAAVVMMAVSGAYLLFWSIIPTILALAACAIMVVIGYYIVTRPSGPNRAS